MGISQDVINAAGPFGNPDGSRADIEDVLESFVAFSNPNVWGGIATTKNDLSARVLVGRKGSGKTIYLRRLQDQASQNESVYADAIQQSVPTTESVVKFCQWFSPELLTEKWSQLWLRAILRSLVSHLLHAIPLRKNLEEGVLEKISELSTKYDDLMPSFGTPLSAYSQVSEMIEYHNTANHISGYFSNRKWAELEYDIAEIMKDVPPIFIYIDAVDEEFVHAPMYWLRCQKGLFYQVMRLVRDTRLGSRLHVVICVRDLVLASVHRSEHSTRYWGEPHIRILKWNKSSVEYFLEQKLRKLPKEYFVKFDSSYSLASWLGTETIWNKTREVDEPIAQYLLRHTRMLPRDVVVMGNMLCIAIMQAKSLGNADDIQALVREEVEDVATILGNEQLRICANHIISNNMPKAASAHRYSELYIGNDEHARTVRDQLKSLILGAKVDRLDKEKFEAFRDTCNISFPEADALSALWLNGLIGFVEHKGQSKRVVFYSEDSPNDFNLPLERDEYVFHSILIDAVGIQAVGNPVVSFKMRAA